MAASTEASGIDLSGAVGDPAQQPVPTEAPASVPSDAPLAQDQIHTTYGTADAPGAGESIATTVTPDGVTLTAYDYEGDSVVDSVSADFQDGTGATYYDADADGSFDAVYYTNADFDITGTEVDSDHDGRIDTVYVWGDDADVSYIDDDGDGLADRMYSSDTGDVTDLT